MITGFLRNLGMIFAFAVFGTFAPARAAQPQGTAPAAATTKAATPSAMPQSSATGMKTATPGSGTTHPPTKQTGNAAVGAASGGHGKWTWMGGASVPGQKGIYGTLGRAAPGNVPGARGWAVSWTDAAVNIPGARESAASWTDAAGNFWMFGGFGFDSTGTNGDLNDLWKYSAGEWTWMGGSNVISAKGTYGTKGTAAAGNIPGARTDSVRWTDAAGNVWLFGGYGYDSAGKQDILNDLWKYSAGEWTWMGGSKVIDARGVFGIKGMAAAGNIPGARWDAAGWVDPAGNMWLFGGFVQYAAGEQQYLNDLWKYEP